MILCYASKNRLNFRLAAGIGLLSAWSAASVAASAIDPPAQIPKGLSLPLPKPDVERAPLAQGNARTLASSSLIATASVSTVFQQDFESGANGWTVSGSWEIGVPVDGPGSGANSLNAASTDLDGAYPPNADDSLTSPPVVLPVLSTGERLKLSFDEWFELESGYDDGFVEISTDNGGTWTPLSTRSGSSGSNYRQKTVDLAAYAGQAIMVRFRLVSDDSYEYAGWTVDNVRIVVETPEAVELSLPSLNAQNFPFVFVDAAVKDNVGVCPPTIQDFHVFEDGVTQTDLFSIIPPNQGGGARLVDLVFIIDNSGSLGDEQAAVEANIADLVDQLTAAGVDLALGLTRYGQSALNGLPILEDGGNLTTDADYFKNTLLGRNVIDGGYEPGYQAIMETGGGFNFRPGSRRILMIVTDETPLQGSTTQIDADTALDAADATLFAVTYPDLFGDFEPLVDEPSSQLIDILSPFDEVFDFISDQISNTYRLSYRATNQARNGVERAVRVTVKCGVESGEATTTYRPGAEPIIQRTQPTINLSNSGQVSGQPLVIEASIVDAAEPLVTDTSLFYRGVMASSYTAIPMTRIGGDASSGVYTATIPGADVAEPGISYYLTATDGEVTSSSPTTNPGANSYQIAVLPNEPPSLTHTPVTTAAPALPIEIMANATDSTNTLSAVNLHYRKLGTLTYLSVPMTAIGGNVYRASIPASDVTTAGVQYYLSAVDDFGVTTTVGSADTPRVITVSAVTGNPCDLDGNNRIDAADLRIFTAQCMANPTATGCDLNNDGRFTSADITAFNRLCRSSRGPSRTP